MPTLIKKLGLVVLVKYEFLYREKLKLIFFRKFRTIKLLMRQGKAMSF